MIALLEGAQTGRLHAFLRHQLLDAFRVHRAPDAARPASREADGVGRVVKALADAVDPSVRESFIERFLVGNSATCGLLVETNKEFRFRGVVFREPRAETGGRIEEFRLHGWALRGRRSEEMTPVLRPMVLRPPKKRACSIFMQRSMTTSRPATRA